jgi:hypothetical protein
MIIFILLILRLKKQEKIRFQGKEFEYLSNGSSGIHELALAFQKIKTACLSVVDFPG